MHIYIYIYIYIPGLLDSRILPPLSKRLILLIIFLYKSTFPGLDIHGPRFRDLGILPPTPSNPGHLDSRILLPLSKTIILLIIFL